MLKANRKKIDGSWLKGCSFAWGFLDNEGKPHELEVALTDETFGIYQGRESLPNGKLAIGKKDYRPLTAIRVCLEIRKSEANMDEEEDAQMDADVAARKAQLAASPPTAKDLGVPLYPGAVFNLDATAGMSMGEGMQTFIYLSNDPPVKLVAFYEKATGKKSEKIEGAIRIVLKGKGLMPDHFLSIEPNTMFGGSAKTALSIWRMSSSDEED
jgi:hypothetical protein